jgi:hypothetical protein
MFQTLPYDALYAARTEMMLDGLRRRHASNGMPRAALKMFIDAVTNACFMRGPPLLAIWRMGLLIDRQLLQAEEREQRLSEREQRLAEEEQRLAERLAQLLSDADTDSSGGDHAAGAAAGAAADTAALDLPPVAEGDESRDYSERFKCCGCLESKALDDFVVADCGHAVLCRECWAQNQQTQRRDVCPWCRHSVRRWCRTRLWPTTNKMMVLDDTHDTITTRAAFNCMHCINPYLSRN